MFRLSLVAMLVLLQLLAPLVHAHTGQRIFAGLETGKLHLPGLEALNAPQYDRDTGGHVQASVAAPAEGLTVGIHNGIKQTSPKAFADTDPSYYLHTAAWLSALSFIADEMSFSPPDTPFLSRFPFTAHTPRAPPALA